MNTHLASRRGLLAVGMASTLAVLSGCEQAVLPSRYHGVDLTGVKYGRDFRLADPQGRQRALADFKGKLVLLFFGFTQCPDVCPTALSRAVEIKRLLGPDGERMQVVFVTVDPERDTPAVLDAYMHAFDPGFLGLHGDAQQTRATADAFKVFYKKVPTGSSYTMDHTAITFVFDPQSRLRLALRHNQTSEECAEDLRQILAIS